MGKQKTDYFELLTKQSDYCVRAAAYLAELLEAYSPTDLAKKRQGMHEIEHTADLQRHEILEKLAREFITPIDQEDLLGLAHIIDDVTDALDDVVIKLYMYQVSALPPAVLELMQVVKRCVAALRQAVGELHAFKKSDRLHGYLVEVNHIEEEADAIYIEATAQLFRTEQDARKLFGILAVLDQLENCCDLCEHATDVIEQTIMKNA